MPTPEEHARLNIDRQLTACGWTLQSQSIMGMSPYIVSSVMVNKVPE